MGKGINIIKDFISDKFFLLMRKIKELKWNSNITSFIYRFALPISMIYNFLLFLFIYFFSYPNWETSDDFLISTILSGIHGDASPFILVMEYPLSYLLYFLQKNFPYLNWLTMLELFSIWCSFVVFTWIFIKKKKILSVLIGLIFPILFELNFFVRLHYTRSACLLSFAGLFLIYYFCYNKKKLGGLLAGVALTLLGAMIRKSCFYLAIPFVFIWVLRDGMELDIKHIFKAKKNRKLKKQIKCLLYNNRRFLVNLLIVVSIVFVESKFTEYVYWVNEEIQEYRVYNKARADVFDYLPSEYADNQEIYEQLGFSENDYKMLKANIFYDDYYSLELFEELLSVEKEEKESIFNKISVFFDEFDDKLKYFSQGRNKGKETIVVYLFLIFVLGVSLRKIKKNIYIVYSFIGTLIVAAYFIWTGRFPPWVQDSVYLMGCFCILYGIEYPRFSVCKESVKQVNSFVLKLLFCMLLIGVINWGEKQKDILENANRRYDVEEILQYFEERKENVYLIDNFAYSPFPIVDTYGTLRGLEKNDLDNVMRVGSWFIKHPVYQQQLENCGISSPLKDLLEDNVYLWANKNGNTIEMYRTYFREHYEVEVEVSKGASWGEYAIFKFKIAEED